MRYFEFIVPEPSVKDRLTAQTLKSMGYDLYKLREGIANKTGKVLKESIEVDQFREFISHLVNNPKDLLVGQEYDALCIMFDSTNRTIKTITYHDMCYTGFDNDVYMFKDLNGEDEYLYRVEDYGHGMLATILYEDKKLAGQYKTLLLNKYGGEYEFEWR